MRAQLAAVEIASPSEAARFQTSLGPLFVSLTAGRVSDARCARALFAFSESQLLTQPETLRQDADTVLARPQIHIAPVPLGPAAGCRHVRFRFAVTASSPGIGLWAPTTARF